jgi:alpha-tubulin suppressor-like RCC1 family protein
MSKLVKKFDYDLNKNFYDAPRKSGPGTNFYEANKNLLYWLRFTDESAPHELSLSNKSSNATYVGSVDNSESFIGNRKYPSLVAKANNYATFLDDRINFYDFDTVDEFTTSLWILPKQNPNNTIKILDFKYQCTTLLFSSRISLELLTSGNFLIRISRDTSSSVIPSITGTSLNLNEWNHIVFTYKKSIASANVRIFKYYINGIEYVPVSPTQALNVGIGPGPLEIVNFFGTANNNCIEVSELATWNRVLDAGEVQAIYNATRGNSWVQASGFVSDAPRLALRDRDHATGSYPTRSAHGMPDFNGRYPVNFDDLKTIDFVSNYAEASIRFGSTPRLNTSLHLTGAYDQLSYRHRFEFRASGSLPWDNKGSCTYVPLRTLDETSSSMASITKRLVGAINDSGIGVESTVSGVGSLDLRQHVPLTGTFEQGNLLRFTNPAIRSSRLDITASHFRLGTDELHVAAMSLPVSSPWRSYGSVFPHEPSDIETHGRAILGISDAHVTFTPGQDLLPFVDSRLDIDESKPFYSQGTPESELPGFSARLSSKDSFVIDINPSEEHEVYFSTGTNDIVAHGGISYFNFHGMNRGWERTADAALQEIEDFASFFTYAAVDYTNSSFSIATSSLLAVIPSTDWGAYPWNSHGNPESTRIENTKNLGKPCSFAGFPQDTKFDPKSEQKISLKDYINGPFLLEKVVVEVSGVLASYPPYSSSIPITSDPEPLYQVGYGNQVIIINTYDTDIDDVVENTLYYVTGALAGVSGNPVEKKKKISTFKRKKLKDIVWYGRIGSYASGSDVADDLAKAERTYQNEQDFFQSPFGKMHDSVYFIKTNELGGIFAVNNPPYATVIEPENFHTGTLVIEAPVRSTGISKNTNFARNLRPWTYSVNDGEAQDYQRSYLFGESLGGRNLFDVSPGRSYIKSVVGSNKIEDITYDFTGGSVTLDQYEDDGELISPYLLMPTDELTIAWVNQPFCYEFGDNFYPENEHNVATIFRTKLSPGIGRVTFYGSYLRDAQPLPPESSQPLTSPAVHEDVRDDSSPYGEARCMDQFLVEPRLTYSGSFLDTRRYEDYESPLGFIAISAGEKHTLGLTFDGRVYAWGNGEYGKLGLGDTEDRLVPTLVESLADKKITSITAGQDNSYAVDSDGVVWSWGSNVNGLLGIGESEAFYNALRPVQVQDFLYVWREDQGFIASVLRRVSMPAAPRVKKIAFMGNKCVVAVLDSTTVLPDPDDKHTYINLCIWGANPSAFDFWTLNNNPYNNTLYSFDFSKPLLVPVFRPSRRLNSDVVNPSLSGNRNYFETNLAGEYFVDAAGGGSHGMLLTSRATSTPFWDKVFTFGSNQRGQLGVGDNLAYDNLFKLVPQIGLLGDNIPANALNFVTCIAAGSESSYAVISKTDLSSGKYENISVKSWGRNDESQLGDGGLLDSNSPLDVNFVGAEPVDFVAASWSNKHVIAISSYYNSSGYQQSGANPPADIVYAWGLNDDYHLGLDNTTSPVAFPTEVVRFESIERNYINPLAAGGSLNSPMGYVVRRLSSQYYGWGDNRLGVGTDSQLDGTDPVRVPTVSNLPITSTRSLRWGSILAGDGNPSQASLQRFVRHFNSNETYYDSHVPRIKEIVERCNTNVSSSLAVNPDGSTEEIGTAYLYLPPAGPKPEDAEVANWLFAFPFEPLFEGVNRATTLSSINRSTDLDPTVIDTLVISGSGGLQYDKVVLETLKYGGPIDQFPFITPLSYMAKPETMAKAFFGFGDYGSRFPLDVSTLKDGNLMAPGFGRVPGDFYYIDETADPDLVIQPRGFKYGLANVLPMPRSAVFRSDRYGQLRDMLEQGQDSHFYEEVKFAGRPARNLGEPAIKFRFISREDGLDLDPEVTNGQNLSYFATSSLPYFDGEGRDRSTTQPDLLPRIQIDLNTL